MSLGSGKKRLEPRGIFAGEIPPSALDRRLQKVVWVKWRQDTEHLGLAPVAPLSLLISLPSKPPSAGWHSSRTLPPVPGLPSRGLPSRAQEGWVGKGEVQETSGLVLGSEVSRGPYSSGLAVSAFLCTNVVVCKCVKCVYLGLYVSATACTRPLCISQLGSWVVRVCLLISSLHTPALLVTPWICGCPCDLCIGIYAWVRMEKREK